MFDLKSALAESIENNKQCKKCLVCINDSILKSVKAGNFEAYANINIDQHLVEKTVSPVMKLLELNGFDVKLIKPMANQDIIKMFGKNADEKYTELKNYTVKVSWFCETCK